MSKGMGERREWEIRGELGVVGVIIVEIVELAYFGIFFRDISVFLNLHISKFYQFEEMYTFMFTFLSHFKVGFSCEIQRKNEICVSKSTSIAIINFIFSLFWPWPVRYTLKIF